jgi:MraZ protein
MLTITGVHECKADAKGRVAIPAPLKKQLQTVLDQGFILKRSVFQPCLELYPIAAWQEVMGKVGRLNRFVKKHNDFIRLFSAGVKSIELDSNARLLIPKDLQEYSGINSQIVMASAVDIIEVWDKEAYERSLQEGTQDFGALAEEVMGLMQFGGDDVS